MKIKNQKTKVAKKDKVLITIFSVIITFSLLCVAGVFLLNSRFFANTENNTGGNGQLNEDIVTPAKIKDKTTNFLVCGIDYAQGSGRGKLTDVVMLVSFDIEGKNIDILQIPRDSYIGEDYPTGKINAIYGQKENGGVQGLAQRISETFDMPIDHYVTINMDAFITVVDKIGGVEVDVPKKIVLEGTTLLPGLQTLNGKKSEIFVRERKSYANGDLGRIDMQRIFLESLLKKVFSLSNGKIVSLAPTLIKEVTTDLTISQMLGYYDHLMKVDKNKDINFHLLPVIGGTHNGLSVLSIKKFPTADLLNEHFRPYSKPVLADELGIIELNKNYEYTPLDNNVQE
ncbi:MAG: LCP family protein [Oscillospiraceae bacterium]